MNNDDATAIPDLDIPPGFEMGVATSAWQIEGDLAGRGRCNWDDFADTPGTIVDGATGDPACDHVHRLDEDLELLSWLGVDAYSFTFSWARVIPGGVGAPSAAGLDFYDRLIDGLLERGIRPFATLFHWDTPSELEQAGGWTNRATAEAFADYADVLATRYSGRIERWATLNEPWCPAFLGYAAGYFAPGATDGGAALSAAYHLMLGHGWAIERLRTHNARNLGIIINIIPTVTDDPADGRCDPSCRWDPEQVVAGSARWTRDSTGSAGQLQRPHRLGLRAAGRSTCDRNTYRLGRRELLLHQSCGLRR